MLLVHQDNINLPRGSAAKASIWYLSGERKIGKLADATSPHMMRDPEAFLSRIAIIAEGATEVGFVKCAQ
ncbi:hypothetical protein [Bradyrhizobium sp. USDA 10063]